MLSGAAQVEIDSLSIGATSDPVTVLEGIAIFRLVERKPPVLRPYAEVRDRAAGLWRRDMAEMKRQALLSELREIAVIQINEEYLASLPVAR
jgi:parvulin-like peptidyl-prolyl isomerase